MANGQLPSTSLLREAERIEREQSALLADLSSRLFPKSQLVLDEAMIASERAILFTLVGQIEADLTGHSDVISWPVLKRSGLLAEPDLLEFLLAHAFFLRLSQRVGAVQLQQSTAWVAGFANLEHGLLKHSASELLIARSRAVALRFSGRPDLAANVFRHLVVQVTAALRSEGVIPEDRPAAVADLIAGHDESAGLPHICIRLALHLAAEGAFGDLRDPALAGVDLFAGSLAVELDCSWHDIIRILGEGGARLWLLLRAAEFSKAEAVSLFALLQPGEPVDGAGHYDEISKDAARRILFSHRISAIHAPSAPVGERDA